MMLKQQPNLTTLFGMITFLSITRVLVAGLQIGRTSHVPVTASTTDSPATVTTIYRKSLVPSTSSRRTLLHKVVTFFPSVTVTSTLLSWPITSDPAHANLNTAAESGVPMIGRFEQLTGAKSFIGSWRYEGTTGPQLGELLFLKNGEVELRSIGDNSNDGKESLGEIIGVGASPWKYVSPKSGGRDTIVSISFTIDVEGQDDVLIFQGTLDSAGGPDRVMEGSIETGRAEVGARGGGPRKRVGSFSAKFIS